MASLFSQYWSAFALPKRAKVSQLELGDSRRVVNTVARVEGDVELNTSDIATGFVIFTCHSEWCLMHDALHMGLAGGAATSSVRSRHGILGILTQYFPAPRYCYCSFSRMSSMAGPGCRGIELMVCSATRYPTPVRPRRS